MKAVSSLAPRVWSRQDQELVSVGNGAHLSAKVKEALTARAPNETTKTADPKKIDVKSCRFESLLSTSARLESQHVSLRQSPSLTIVNYPEMGPLWMDSLPGGVVHESFNIPLHLQVPPQIEGV